MAVYTTYTEEQARKGIEKVALSNLREITHKNFAIANKRIKRLEASNVVSPALLALQKKRGDNPRFVQGGKNLKELQKELAECYAFLNLDTSTVTGARQFEAEVKSMTGVSAKDKKRVSTLFDLLHGVQERLPEKIFGKAVGSDPTMEKIQELVDERTDLDLSEMQLSEDDREDIISKAVDELVKRTTKAVGHGKEELQQAVDAFNAQNKRMF